MVILAVSHQKTVGIRGTKLGMSDSRMHPNPNTPLERAPACRALAGLYPVVSHSACSALVAWVVSVAVGGHVF